MMTGKFVLARGAVSLALGVGLAAALWCCPSPSAAQSIGKASAVKNQVQGIRAGASRSLSTGSSVFNEDTVKTGDNSLAQLLFADQTTFTVASDSQAVLNRVYHPKTGLREKIMRAVAGAFRFVSGVQNPNSNQLQFPQGYVAVRGTIVDILAGASHSIILVDEGAVTVHVYVSGRNYDLVAGQMLIVYSGGRADGPLTMDATLMRASIDIPFPLFGSSLWPGQQQFPDPIESFDTRKDLADIFSASRSSSASNSTGSVCAPGYTPVTTSTGTFCSPNN